MFDIRIIGEKESEERELRETPNFVTPGNEVSTDPSFMSCHGTYTKDGKIYASLAGTVERVNKLISVKREQGWRYQAEVGDVVVGRILEVQQRRWLVDVNARLDAILNLSSVNLPGGERRIKTEEDELKMGCYLAEGDAISAEVHSMFQDGAVCLHTRSLKYGKLGQGTMLRVPPGLVLRTKTHFHDIADAAKVILANNGCIWVAPYFEEVDTGGYAQNFDCVPKTDRDAVSRVRNCIHALATQSCMLSNTTILYAYEASTSYDTKAILDPDVIKKLCQVVVERAKYEGF